MIPIPVQRGLVGTAAVLAALWVGYHGAGTGWVLPVLLVGAGTFIITQRAVAVSGETLLISLLCFGYIVGNRGFAHLNLGGIFIGEWLMAASAGLVLLHIPHYRRLPVRLDAMGWWVVAFIGIGFVRLLPDLRTYGIVAIRDFATVYYALFFLLAQPMARHEGSRSFFQSTLHLAFALLPIGYLLFKAAEPFLMRHVTLGGIPLIFYKGDQVAAFLGLGSLYFTFRYWRTRSVLALVLAALLLLLMLHATMRAAILAYACASMVAVAGGYWRLLRLQALTCALGIVLALGYTFTSGEPLAQSRLYGLYEHIISVADVHDSFHYRNAEAASSGDNNRYRLVWWGTILEETLQDAPITGLGFGTDLAAPFLDAYYGGDVEDFSVRSPHSILVTIASRLGLLGALLMAALVTLMLRRTLRVVQLARAGCDAAEALFYWCASWMLFVTASFGVVIEGPMGAIVFWTLLSLAWESSGRLLEQDTPGENAPATEDSTAQHPPPPVPDSCPNT